MDDKPLDLSRTSTVLARESQLSSSEKSQESEENPDNFSTHEKVSSHEDREKFSEQAEQGEVKTYSDTEFQPISAEKWRDSQNQPEKFNERAACHEDGRDLSEPIKKREENVERPSVIHFAKKESISTEKSQDSEKQPEKSTHERVSSREDREKFSEKAEQDEVKTYSVTEPQPTSAEKSRDSQNQPEKPTYERFASHEDGREFSQPIGKNEANTERPSVISFCPSTSAKKESPHPGKRPSPSKTASPFKKVCTKPEKSSLTGKKILEFSETSSCQENQAGETLPSEDAVESNVMNKRKGIKEPAANLVPEAGQSSTVARKKKNPKQQKAASGICTCSEASTSTRGCCSLHSAGNRKTMNKGKKSSFVCQYCDKVWSYKGLLVRHIRTHTGEKPFSCEQCDRKFATNHYLREHILAQHTTDRPYECSECDKAFASARVFQRHMKHHNERSFLCGECGKSYVTKADLTDHIKVHNNDRAFKCLKCERQFSRKYYLMKHMVISHSGDFRSFKCSVCNGSYGSVSALRKHERSHSETMPYNCAICGIAFKHEVLLEFHEMSHL